jgi:arylsulfatase A
MMERPNIVVIMADDTGYGDIGCYNPESKIPTPNVDRIAAEGTTFTDAHAPCALCTPTRYGLLTGRYYWRTPKKHALVMPYEPPVIEPGRTTIASMLKAQGYTTACVGKWHLGLLYPTADGADSPYTQNEAAVDFSKPLRGGPVELGFDTFYGTAGCSTSDAPYCYIADDRTVGIPRIPSTDDLNALPGFWPGLMTEDWRIDEVDVHMTGEAVEFIENHVRTRGDEPFFLYYPLSAPHNPWVVPEFLQGASGDGPRGDMNVLVDWCVGEVYKALAERGVLDDTLLLFTSDNGPQYNTGKTGHRACGAFRGHKNTPFEGGHRMPFVARWPGHVPVGAVSDEPLSLTDLIATFADLVGGAVPDDAEDSFSVLPALLGQGPGDPSRPAMVFDTGGHRATTGHFAIRRGNWKLIVMADADDAPGSRMLFDLASDPGEQVDLVDRHPLIAAELDRLLQRIKARGSRHVTV